MSERVSGSEASVAGAKRPKTPSLTGRAQIPRFESEWRTRRIDEIADVDPENLSSRTAPDFAFNYVSLDDIDTGQLLGYSRITFAEAPSRARRVLRTDDVLMATVRPNLLGHLLYRGQPPNAVCSTGFAVLRVRRHLAEPRLLYAHLFGDMVSTQVRKLLTGSNYPAISSSDAGALAISCPPTLPEQRAIVSVLWDVDELSQSLEALIAKKRAIKRATMQQLLTGRTQLPGFEGEWERKRLGQLGTFVKGRGITRGDLREVGVPCVRYGELYTRYSNYVVSLVSRVPQSIARKALPIKNGDLLFAGSGETAGEIGTCVAYIGNEPACAGGDIIVLRIAGQDPVYLGHLLNTPDVAIQKARMAQGDAVVHIRAEHLVEILVSLPPLPEQRAIASILSDMDAEITVLEARLAKTRAIKRGAMQQLLTGAIRLPIPDDLEQDAHHDA